MEAQISSSTHQENTSPDLNKLLEQYQKEAEEYAKELLQIRKSSQNSLLERIKTEKMSGIGSSSSVVLVGDSKDGSGKVHPDDPAYGAGISSLPLSSNNSSSITVQGGNNSVKANADSQNGDNHRVFTVSKPSKSESHQSLFDSIEDDAIQENNLKTAISMTKVLTGSETGSNIQIRQSINNLAYSLDKSVQKSIEALTDKVEKAIVRSSRTNLASSPSGELTTISKTVSRNSNNSINSSPKSLKKYGGGNIDYEEEIITITASPQRKAISQAGGLDGIATVKKTEISVNEQQHHHHHHDHSGNESSPKASSTVIIQQNQKVPSPAVPRDDTSLQLANLKESFQRQEQDYLASIKNLSEGNQVLTNQVKSLQDGLSFRDKDIKTLQEQIDLLQKSMKMNFEAFQAKDRLVSMGNTVLENIPNATETDIYDDEPDDLYVTAMTSRRDSNPDPKDNFESILNILSDTMELLAAKPTTSIDRESKSFGDSRVVDIGTDDGQTVAKSQKANESLIKAIEDESKVLILHYRQLQDELANVKDHVRRLENKHTDEVYYLQSQYQKQLELFRDTEKERNQYLSFLEEYGRQYTIFEPGSEAIHPLPFHKHCNELKGRIETLHEALSKQATQLTAKERIIEEKDKAIHVLKKHGATQEKKIKRMEQEVQRVHDAVTGKDKELQQQQMFIKNLEHRISSLEASNNHLEEVICRINESYSVIFDTTSTVG